MQTIKLRQDFITYFRNNGHKFLPPSKVYNDDPSLLFVNAGMNQLKDIFVGKEMAKDGYTKLSNSQICIRAGGKHNDLDDVGKDSYHLTSFEMLGNWSLNDYGKEEAIRLAFNFLIDICKLDVSRIYVTYFEGTASLSEDTETKEIWKKYISEDRIIPGNFDDNFWTMSNGDGPCGNSTEIHYDLIGNRFVPEKVNKDDPTVIEIWNIVFTGYERIDNKYNKMDKLYIDTGMGLERLSMVMQNKPTIYQTDCFRFLMGYAQVLTGAITFTDSYNDNNDVDIAYRLFADHIRTTVIALFQGVEFDCNKRGFVLRKIFRRLLTYGYIHLKDKVEEIFDHPSTKCLISDILDYYLFKKHDANIIWKQLIKEEQLYLGKIKTCDRKYNRYFKKYKDHDVVTNKLKYECGIGHKIIDFIRKTNLIQ